MLGFDVCVLTDFAGLDRMRMQSAKVKMGIFWAIMLNRARVSQAPLVLIDGIGGYRGVVYAVPEQDRRWIRYIDKRTRDRRILSLLHKLPSGEAHQG